MPLFKTELLGPASDPGCCRSSPSTSYLLGAAVNVYAPGEEDGRKAFLF